MENTITNEPAAEQKTGLTSGENENMPTDLPASSEAEVGSEVTDSLSENDVAEAIGKELSKIQAIDPTVNSFDDILNSDTGKVFTEKVRRGYSLYDAFIVSNQKRILKNVTEAVHQSALNSVNSKNHLTGTGVSKAEGLTEVPAKTYSLYRSMFPELSDQQIRAHYAKHNKHN